MSGEKDDFSLKKPLTKEQWEKLIMDLSKNMNDLKNTEKTVK